MIRSSLANWGYSTDFKGSMNVIYGTQRGIFGRMHSTPPLAAAENGPNPLEQLFGIHRLQHDIEALDIAEYRLDLLAHRGVPGEKQKLAVRAKLRHRLCQFDPRYAASIDRRSAGREPPFERPGGPRADA